MADSGKIAAAVVLLGVAGLGVAGWFALGGDGGDDQPGVEATPELAVTTPDAPAVLPGSSSVLSVPADAQPGSIAGRIADLQAQLRDEQAAQLAEAARLGEEIKALHAEVQQLEASAASLEEGELTRLGGRADKKGEKCDPAEPDSRACKRQAQLEGRVAEAQAGLQGLRDGIASTQGEIDALMVERTQALRAVDSLQERLRSDPELVELYAQLAEESR